MPSQMDVFDAAERYREEGRQLIIIAGKDYGSGSSRDWAAKGPWILVHFIGKFQNVSVQIWLNLAGCASRHCRKLWAHPSQQSGRNGNYSTSVSPRRECRVSQTDRERKLFGQCPVRYSPRADCHSWGKYFRPHSIAEIVPHAFQNCLRVIVVNWVALSSLLADGRWAELPGQGPFRHWHWTRLLQSWRNPQLHGPKDRQVDSFSQTDVDAVLVVKTIWTFFNLAIWYSWYRRKAENQKWIGDLIIYIKSFLLPVLKLEESIFVADDKVVSIFCMQNCSIHCTVIKTTFFHIANRILAMFDVLLRMRVHVRD